MDRGPKRHDADRALPDDESQGEAVEELRRRQAAASLLRAARLTDDATERESLRRQAAELLSRRTAGQASHTGSASDGRRPRTGRG
jgi:hypothetical protein